MISEINWRIKLDVLLLVVALFVDILRTKKQEAWQEVHVELRTHVILELCNSNNVVCVVNTVDGEFPPIV